MDYIVVATPGIWEIRWTRGGREASARGKDGKVGPRDHESTSELRSSGKQHEENTPTAGFLRFSRFLSVFENFCRSWSRSRKVRRKSDYGRRESMIRSSWVRLTATHATPKSPSNQEALTLQLGVGVKGGCSFCLPAMRSFVCIPSVQGSKCFTSLSSTQRVFCGCFFPLCWRFVLHCYPFFLRLGSYERLLGPLFVQKREIAK
jgi:hypothetical protein